MLEIFNYWQVDLILAIILFVSMHQANRVIAQKIEDTSNLAILVGIIGSAVFICMMIFSKIYFPRDWRIWVLLIISGLLYAMQDFLKFRSYKYLDVSVNVILFQISKIFFIIYGLVFFKEKLNIYEILGIICVMLGVIMVSLKKKKFRINKHAWLVIGAAVFFSTAMTIDVGISKKFNLPFYFLIIYAIPAISIFIVQKKTLADLKKDLFHSKKVTRLILMTGIFSAFGMLFYLLSFRRGELSIVAPLSSVTVMLNIVVSYILLKERTDILKRIIAGILVIIGVVLLV